MLRESLRFKLRRLKLHRPKLHKLKLLRLKLWPMHRQPMPKLRQVDTELRSIHRNMYTVDGNAPSP
jgi:hypothetical protein